MIITCPNCDKKFQIESSLIPEGGRDLKCGSCNHVWFYEQKNENFPPLTLNEDSINKIVEDNLPKKEIEKIAENKKSINKEKTNNKEKKIEEISNNKKNEIKKESSVSKFFSYLIVLIISFVAFTILVDTLKAPIVNVFPGVEILLFNLFETLQDIKLFIIDLT